MRFANSLFGKLLTYMSMRAEMEEAIRSHCSPGGALELAVPTMVLVAQVRPIYMTREVHDRVFGPEAEEAARMGFLEADLVRFINGDRITVARGQEESCNLKPLTPVTGEVWEIRSRDPKPSLRVFGRFAAQDVFIATNLEYRKFLGRIRSRNWAIEIGRCKAIWRRLFPFLDPHSGDHLIDYISSNVIDLDLIP